MLPTQATLSRPTIKLTDLLRLVSAIRQQQYRFDVVVVANIVLFTAMMSLKKAEVRNATVGHVRHPHGNVLPGMLSKIKGFPPGGPAVQLPREVRHMMRKYLRYLQQHYPGFGMNMHLFPNKNGAKYKNDKLTKHIVKVFAANRALPGCQVKLTLGLIRQSGICYYFEWKIQNDPHRALGPAAERSAEFSGNSLRTVHRRHLWP